MCSLADAVLLTVWASNALDNQVLIKSQALQTLLQAFPVLSTDGRQAVCQRY